jgi:queuine tRNA-ribosyltransferase
MLKFEIIYQSRRSLARVGRLHTPHGIIDTPGFVPVGTNATIKAVDSTVVKQLGIQLIFCNTYHLLLQPGTSIIRAAGGLHSFMDYQGPLITDSGGFQVFSLAYGTVHAELKSKGLKKNEGSVIKISEEGVLFRSYRDGSLVLLTPESSIQAQKDLGADIIIPLDELPPYHISHEQLKISLERTHRWELRSLAEHLKNPSNQAIFAVIHGGVDPLLRRYSSELLREHPFDGFAIGGSLGKSHEEMIAMLSLLMPSLERDRPIHLLGIGDTASLKRCIPLGIDTFDSSHPTRCARHGLLFTAEGPLKIEQSIHQSSFIPPDPQCSCLTCTHYTRAYLHHLFKAHEMTAFTLATIHNLTFMVRFMATCREKILQGEL